jgi:hypothetical protein
MLQVCQRPQPWLRWSQWLIAAFLLVWILWAFLSNEVALWSNPYLFLVPLWLTNWGQGQRLILAGPVLLVQQGVTMERVPLAVAEVKALKRGWQVRWTEGRLARRQTLHADDGFRQAVERAADAARQADPATVPITEREAARAVPMVPLANTYLSGGLHVWLPLGLVVLAIVFKQPLVLLPIPLLVLFSDRLFAIHHLLLLDDHLYVLSPKGEVHPIPLTAVRELRPGKRSQAVVTTTDAAYPVLTVQRYFGDVDFLVCLQKRMAGEPAVPPRPAPAPKEAQTANVLRCALCGRPEPGAVAGGGVFICERCSGRARYEASETGHGLAGKEPKPL